MSIFCRHNWKLVSASNHFVAGDIRSYHVTRIALRCEKCGWLRGRSIDGEHADRLMEMKP